ncbi:MAG: hypothetical protein ACP5G0_10195 [Desulfomonilia bacterium]
MEFIHPVLNEEVNAIGGHYMITRLDRIPHPKGEILYFVGHAVTESSCCGLSGCGYGIVAGHVISFQSGYTADERIISVVDPVEETFYEEIAKKIAYRDGVTQVHFVLPSGEKKMVYVVQ